ncbi:MAG TPA: hypothetical protein VFG86_15295, partial [Chloroflexota bacterium]|nr:hypothetical protein [Chloroflexota bacterium]
MHVRAERGANNRAKARGNDTARCRDQRSSRGADHRSRGKADGRTGCWRDDHRTNAARGAGPTPTRRHAD